MNESVRYLGTAFLVFTILSTNGQRWKLKETGMWIPGVLTRGPIFNLSKCTLRDKRTPVTDGVFTIGAKYA